MKLGKKVAFAETFERVCLRVTLIEGKGHKINLRWGNWLFFALFDIEYLWYYLQQSCELWSKGSLWGDL